MSKLRTTLGCLLAAAVSLSAAHASRFDPALNKLPQDKQPSELMVLGTPHLSGWPEQFDPALLDDLIGRLASWRPRIIATESLSGAQCDMLRRYPARYAATVGDYCWDPAPARDATGLDVPAATEEAERLLANWPAAPSPAQRRKLASLFLASGDRTSALVQWLRLPPAERHAGDGLDDALVEILSTVQKRRNEVYLIAAPLAARLGLERVVPMDDHSADRPEPDEAAFGAAITKAWSNPASDRRHRFDQQLARRLTTKAGVVAAYRAYNDAAQADLIYRSDFGAALMETSPQRFGRRYVAWWETRNLRMAANIRDAMAVQPGGRTLVLVGAAHKWYLEAYLRQMHEIEVVSSGDLLR